MLRLRALICRPLLDLPSCGKGKTESIKDMAKELGRSCVVFSCGRKLDGELVGVVQDLAPVIRSQLPGTFIIFDEWNRSNDFGASLRFLLKLLEEVRAKEPENMKGLICITFNPSYQGTGRATFSWAAMQKELGFEGEEPPMGQVTHGAKASCLGMQVPDFTRILRSVAAVRAEGD